MIYQNKTFIVDTAYFKIKLLHWADRFSHACILDSNYNAYGDSPDSLQKFDLLAGIGCKIEFEKKQNTFEELKLFYDAFCEKKKNYLFGYFTYDLKNEIEKLSSENIDGIQFPGINFFVPEYVFELNNDKLTIYTGKDGKNPKEILKEIFAQEINEDNSASVKLSERVSKKEYIESFEKILKHIHRGDIYEMNYCQEFFAEDVQINPKSIFQKLSEISPAPFSCYYKLQDRYLLCASPERFLRKEGNKIISQPIKGTIRRGINKEEDLFLKSKLQHDEKEKSENVMIVDLVRNDLSRIAKRGSVQAEELFGIYSFMQVHHMISTVSCIMKENIHPVEVIKAVFPMGSMTGAPKIKAMELIEKYEKTKRGLFSGSVGYFSPEGNFDFNVVIRSIFYNAMNHYLSVLVGGAITAKATSENEYIECFLKAKAMMKALSNEQNHPGNIFLKYQKHLHE